MAKILLVDDNEEVRRAMSRALERMGHDVVSAADGRKALKVLHSEPCDLVVTDINMPEMDGIELIMALRKGWPTVPIIAVSGGGLVPKELLLDNAEVLGVVSTLAKPVGFSELEDAVNEAIRTSTDQGGNDGGP